MMNSMYLSTMSDSWTPNMHYINTFHDHVMVVLVLIIVLISQVYVSVMWSKSFSRSMKSSEWLETLWTVLPCVVLTSLAAPSLMTLYLSEEVSKPSLSVKVVGHQWYWSYEWSDFGPVEFDSYMEISEEMLSGGMRLLEVDERLVVPMNLEVRVVVTSADVIHSWSLPSAGLKVDAVPGRINQLMLMPTRVGVMYGQCSEICGSLHSFMPIAVEVVTLGEFMNMLS